MQPYENLRGHYRETPGETLVVVCLDLLALFLPVAAIFGAVTDLEWLPAAVVVAGTAVVVWVTWAWNVVADLRGWE